MPWRYIQVDTTDPAFNLALEEYVFENLSKDYDYFILWQNASTVVVGRHQNTFNEVDEAFIRENNITVVRRLSGGGAVYHDMGNLNFTIIADADGEALDFGRFCDIVIRALAQVGVTAERNGRNDMTIDGKKFSGNAQYIRHGRVMHHGTILFDSNGTVLANALQVDSAKIQAKGIKSVRSRVTNVSEYLEKGVTLEQFRQQLLGQLLQETGAQEYVLTPEDRAAIEKLRTERYDTWQWNFGTSPECTLSKKARVEGCGTVEVYLTVAHGRIEKAQFHGDFFSAKEPEALAARLVGCRPDSEDYRKALENVDVSEYFMGMTTGQFLQLLEA